MKESQRIISEYKRKLPKLKEKVAAVALLLAVSTSMLITVSFAWIALSSSPEVSNVNTSIASNGNLEIALATGTLANNSAPGASQVGDSNKDTIERNLTWGNLVNLGDVRYGLDNIVLRPALLNTFGLVNNPLYGPVYDETGRVIDMNTNFGYSAWESNTSRFVSTQNLGVRAITSMTYGVSSSSTIYNEKLNAIEAANSKVQTSYQSIAYNDDYMDSLASMMAGYMVKNVFMKNDNLKKLLRYSSISGKDLDNFITMYNALIDCFEDQAVVFAELLNLQAEVDGKTTLANLTGEQILEMSYDITAKTAYNALKAAGYTAKAGGFVEEIDTFISDYQLLVIDIVKVQQIRNQVSGSVTWNETAVPKSTDGTTLDTLIEHLVNVNTCTITGGDYKDLKVQNIGGTAALALMEAGVCQTHITNGVLYRFDNRSGARLKNEEGKPLTLTVSTTIMGQKSISSNVATSAKSNYFDKEKTAVKDIINTKFGAPELIANDSYGFAVDFWMRTNAVGSYLTLQGNVLTESHTEPVKGKDMDGNEVDLYTITVKVESETETTASDDDTPVEDNILSDMMVATYDVYYYTYENESKEEVTELRFADNHQPVTAESLGLVAGETVPNPTQKMQEIETVIGFEGDNRVWEGDQHSLLTVNSTTQGSGSCYVFYAETPVDQERSLELLQSMKVAFIDDAGTLLATGYMDTDRHYASAGKVIVPLVLAEDSVSIGTDEDGDPLYAITALEQNVATRITALVYLDGTSLTNDKVLASADIEGRMNIQFGSSAALYPLDNENLYNSEMYVEAESISPNEFDYDTITEGQTMTSAVKVRVTGTQPQTVTANFIRRINATQGSPEETFILNDENNDGVWEGTYTFQYPGEYILRSVTVDGVERDLKIPEGSDFPKVTVNGFTINSVSYSLQDFIMTDAGSYSGNVELKFATNDPAKMPSSVIGKFTRDDGAAVNVNFSYNPTQGLWQGKADFVSSGEYTMQYVVLDGQYVELAENHRKTVELILGMRVNVETTSPTSMKTTDGIESLAMQVEILDNNGDIIPNLANASLTYYMSGSTDITENFHAKLLWNSVEQYYEGEFRPQAGIWEFGNVAVKMGTGVGNTNVLTSVNSDSPVFTIMPPDPPKYYDSFGAENQFANQNQNAYVQISLEESESARVFAKFEKLSKDGNSVVDTKYVEYAGRTISGDLYVYSFYISETGIWRLVGASAFDVYDQDRFYACPEGGVVDEAGFNSGYVFNSETTAESTNVFQPITIYVLNNNDVSVVVSYSDGIFDSTNETTGIFGKDAQGKITSEFMATHSIDPNEITVTVSDDYGLIKAGRFSVSNIAFDYNTLVHDTKYGGYSSDTTTQEFINKYTIPAFVFSGEKGLYKNSNTVNFQYAAKYTPSNISYTVSGGENSSSNNVKLSGLYDIEVWSISPTVIISEVSPSGTFNADKTGQSGSGHTANGASSSISTDKTEAWVYYKCVTNTYGRTTYHSYINDDGYYNPSVTLELKGVEGFTSAKLSFNNNTRIYTNVTYTTPNWKTGVWETTGGEAEYTWSSGQTKASRYIGYCWAQKGRITDAINANGKKTPAGTITATSLTLVHGGITYSIPVNITINNPY